MSTIEINIVPDEKASLKNEIHIRDASIEIIHFFVTIKYPINIDAPVEKWKME